MRLIDADNLECDTAFDVIDKDYIAVSKRQIDDAPTVEAIPVEQVAEMLYKVAEGATPCVYLDVNHPAFDKDDWCDSNCNKRNSRKKTIKCWLNALREGWLNDVRNT